MTAFPHLFQPLQLRGQTLRNRIGFGAHRANMAKGGLPGARHLGYYRERARGGAAMIVVEPVPVRASAVLTRGNNLAGSDAVMPGFRAVTKAVHAEGALVLDQLYLVGQHGDADNSFMPNLSPSGLPSFHDSDGSHRMSKGDIAAMIDAYVAAVLRAKAAGFDGVRLFAACNALIDQFWTPFNNRRSDRWGGSLENRVWFGAAIMDGIRKAAAVALALGSAFDGGPPRLPTASSVAAPATPMTQHTRRRAHRVCRSKARPRSRRSPWASGMGHRPDLNGRQAVR